MSTRIQKLLFPLVFFFLLLIFFSPYLTGNNFLYEGDYTGSDSTELNIPFRYWAAQQLKHGDLPLWNDQLSSGFPQLAEGQTGVFYPFNLIFFILLPVGFAVLAVYFINFLLAGIFTFFFCRSLKLSAGASWLAATAFSFSGFFIFRLKHLNLINAAIWLPLIFYLIEKLIASKRKDLIVVLLSGVYAIQFFAGHPQISYISVLSGFIYYFIRLCHTESFKKMGWWLKLFVLLLPWVVIGILTLGLTAIQLFPTYQLSKYSVRGAWSDYHSSVGSLFFQPLEFLTSIFPYIFGNPANNSYGGFKLGFMAGFWEDSAYFGLIPLLLSMTALILSWRRNRLVRQLSFFLVFCLFFILANYNPLFKWVWQILPSYKVFRFQQRFLLPFILIMATLAGAGYDVISLKLSKLGATAKAQQNNIYGGLPIIVVLIVSVEMLFMSLQFVGNMPTSYLSSAPASVEWLKRDTDQFRIASLYYQLSWDLVFSNSSGWTSAPDLYLENRNLLPPNLNLMFGVSTYNDRGWNEGGQLDGSMAKLLTLIDQNISLDAKSRSVLLGPGVLKVLGLQNVKYLLSYYPVNNTELTEVKTIKEFFLPTLHIYQNPYYLKRAFVVTVSKQVPVDQQIPALFGSDFNPATEVLTADKYNLSSDKTNAKVELISRQNNKYAYKVVADGDGLLVLSQTFYPGWSVKIDGEKAKLTRVDGVYSGLVISSGEHRVELKYDPNSFEWGLSISLMTIILIIIYFAAKLLISMRAVFKL